MILADFFVQELAKDGKASDVVRKLGQKLADDYRTNLETLAALAKQNCELCYKLEDARREQDLPKSA